MLNYVNPFSDGINLKKHDCGVPCSHIRCKMSVCNRARIMADGKLDLVMNTKKQVLALLFVGNYADAIELATSLYNDGHVTFERFESFRIQHFSCELRPIDRFIERPYMEL